jgi:hypothetical protein
MASIPGPLTYTTAAQLATDPTFRGRVEVALLILAEQFQAETPGAAGTTGHVSRILWAARAIANPAGMAAQIEPLAALDTGIQTAGSAATDAQVLTAVTNALTQLI